MRVNHILLSKPAEKPETNTNVDEKSISLLRFLKKRSTGEAVYQEDGEKESATRDGDQSCDQV